MSNGAILDTFQDATMIHFPRCRVDNFSECITRIPFMTLPWTTFLDEAVWNNF